MLRYCYSRFGGRHIYFRYNATFGGIVDNTIKQLDLKDIGIVVRILSVDVLELEITLGIFYPLPNSIMCMYK